MHAVRDGLINARLLESLSQNVCWYLTAPVFMNEWRRVQRQDLYGQDFAANVNARLAKLYPAAAQQRQPNAEKKV